MVVLFVLQVPETVNVDPRTFLVKEESDSESDIVRFRNSSTAKESEVEMDVVRIEMSEPTNPPAHADDGKLGSGSDDLYEANDIGELTLKREDSKAPFTINVAAGVDRLLNLHNIDDDIWVKDFSGDQYQVTFQCEDAGGQAEALLQDLREIGVGYRFGSVSVLPLSIAKRPVKDTASRDRVVSEDEVAETNEQKKFRETVRARAIVDSLLDQISVGAALSFDFILLVLVASILAGVGLAMNNAVVIVASMLVSPIMGPILGVTFGTVVHDWKLVKIGLRTEVEALLMCVLSGMAIGACFVAYGEDLEWPTFEMSSRGDTVGLYIGIAIALPSGIGVALSVLGNNTNSLVGVAISASLLPPAVNAGMNFAYAIHLKIQGDEEVFKEHIRIGYISFLLTIINIGCIYISAMVMFKVKEVAPFSNKQKFWREDIFHARDYVRTVKGPEGAQLKKELEKALEQMKVHNDRVKWTHLPFGLDDDDTSFVSSNMSTLDANLASALTLGGGKKESTSMGAAKLLAALTPNPPPVPPPLPPKKSPQPDSSSSMRRKPPTGYMLRNHDHSFTPTTRAAQRAAAEFRNNPRRRRWGNVQARGGGSGGSGTSGVGEGAHSGSGTSGVGEGAHSGSTSGRTGSPSVHFG